jgi:hypothetical protein
MRPQTIWRRCKSFRTKLSGVPTTGTDIHHIHIALNVRTLTEEIKRASAKLHQRDQATWQRNHSSTCTTLTPDQIRCCISRSQMQTTYKWRTSVAVAPYNKNKTRMDTPHLRSQGPQSDRYFYPHIIIHPRELTSTRPFPSRFLYNPTFPASQLLSLPPAFTLVSYSTYLTLKMEAICSFEKPVDFQRITWRYITEGNTLHTRNCLKVAGTRCRNISLKIFTNWYTLSTIQMMMTSAL